MTRPHKGFMAEGDKRKLLDEVLRAIREDRPVRPIMEAAGKNPLYVGELLRWRDAQIEKQPVRTGHVISEAREGVTDVRAETWSWSRKAVTG